MTEDRTGQAGNETKWPIIPKAAVQPSLTLDSLHSRENGLKLSPSSEKPSQYRPSEMGRTPSVVLGIHLVLCGASPELLWDIQVFL